MSSVIERVALRRCCVFGPGHDEATIIVVDETRFCGKVAKKQMLMAI